MLKTSRENNSYNIYLALYEDEGTGRYYRILRESEVNESEHQPVFGPLTVGPGGHYRTETLAICAICCTATGRR